MIAIESLRIHGFYKHPSKVGKKSDDDISDIAFSSLSIKKHKKIRVCPKTSVFGQLF